MALLLFSGLSSSSLVLPAAPVHAPVRATFPIMQEQGSSKAPYQPPYGQPQMAGLTIEQVYKNAAKAAGKDPNYDPKMKGDGQAKQNVYPGGWSTLK